MNKETLHTSLASQISSSRKVIDDLYKQLTAKDVAEAKSDANDARIATMVVAAVSHIPKPKDGARGQDGAIGKDGINGKNGTNGVDGIDGIDGIKGDTGKAGASGRDGNDGKDGIGVDGSIGSDGADGKDGVSGTNGVDGNDGLDGLDGKNGKDGTDGVDGTTGIDGKNGSDGLRGSDGINGLDGLAGKDGINGQNGLNGKAGVKGKDGLKGKEGARGKKGDTGIGIKEVSIDGATLKFSLTDGKYKKVTLPLTQGKGGGPVVPDSFQRASRVPYNNKNSGISAENVQEAIDVVAQMQSGNPYPASTAHNFMYTFNSVHDTHSAKFVYNAGKLLISKSIVNISDDVLYLIDFTYTTGVLTSKLITDLGIGDSVETVFTYEDGLLTQKLLTYNS